MYLVRFCYFPYVCICWIYRTLFWTYKILQWTRLYYEETGNQMSSWTCSIHSWIFCNDWIYFSIFFLFYYPKYQNLHTILHLPDWLHGFHKLNLTKQYSVLNQAFIFSYLVFTLFLLSKWEHVKVVVLLFEYLLYYLLLVKYVLCPQFPSFGNK